MFLPECFLLKKEKELGLAVVFVLFFWPVLFHVSVFAFYYFMLPLQTALSQGHQATHFISAV